MIVFAVGLALVLCAGAGLFFGAYQAAQSPGFYRTVLGMIVEATVPEILEPEDPETADRRRAVVTSGAEWDHIRKRERQR